MTNNDCYQCCYCEGIFFIRDRDRPVPKVRAVALVLSEDTLFTGCCDACFAHKHYDGKPENMVRSVTYNDSGA